MPPDLWWHLLLCPTLDDNSNLFLTPALPPPSTRSSKGHRLTCSTLNSSLPAFLPNLVVTSLGCPDWNPRSFESTLTAQISNPIYFPHVACNLTFPPHSFYQDLQLRVTLSLSTGLSPFKLTPPSAFPISFDSSLFLPPMKNQFDEFYLLLIFLLFTLPTARV